MERNRGDFVSVNVYTFKGFPNIEKNKIHNYFEMKTMTKLRLEGLSSICLAAHQAYPMHGKINMLVIEITSSRRTGFVDCIHSIQEDPLGSKA